MASPFIAEIRIFPFNFAPRGWGFCNGQLLPLAQNTALFSLVGTTYGGDGRTNFALPNLQGRAPMHAGNGPGLTPRDLGEPGGLVNVTLSEGQMASHSHALNSQARIANQDDPGPANWLGVPGDEKYGPPTVPAAAMDPTAIGLTGGGQPHTNQQPYLTLNFCIALQGIFPQRS